MELSFILNAMKRYWWVIIAFTVLGTAVGLQFTTEKVAVFQSRALLYIAPPSDSVQGQFVAATDRYLLGQLMMVQSSSMADAVAEEVGGGLTGSVVAMLTSVTQNVGTDVVEIKVESGDGAQAQAIAEGYVKQYFLRVTKQIEDAQGPALANLNAQLTDLHAQLDDINTQIEAKLAPYLSGSGGPIPEFAVIDPKLSDDRAILLAHLDRVSQARDRLELNSKVQVSSREIQPASKATLTIPVGTKKKLFAAMFTGVLLGVVAAAALASLSKRSLDRHQMAEILGAEVLGEMPKMRVLSKNRRTALEALPQPLAPFVDMLNVRAETNARVGEAFTVVVVGTERSSGCTTVAEAMANRFAAHGSRVLLIDADQRHSELTHVFAAGAPGIPALLAYAATNATGRRSTSSGRLDPFSATAVPGLSVVGIGDKSVSSGLRRQNLPELVDAAKHYAHVVVLDGGALLDSALTVQLTQLVDAVVLCVPVRKQLNSSLATIKTQLADARGEVLPVFVPVGRRSRRNRGEPQQAMPAFGLSGMPDVEQISLDDLPREPAPARR